MRRRGLDADAIYWNLETLGIIAMGAKTPRAQLMELTPGTYPVSCQTVEWSWRGNGVTRSGVGQTQGGLQIQLIAGWALLALSPTLGTKC